MQSIKSYEFNIDNACIEIIYDNGSKMSLYTPMIEEFLRTTVHSRSKLNWLIENEPLDYAQMMLDGTMQDYLDRMDDTTQEQLKSYTKRLAERFPLNIAEDIAREFMMYG